MGARDETADAAAMEAAWAAVEATAPSPHPPYQAQQALRVLEGEAAAREFVTKARSGQAGGDELAVEVCKLYGPGLRGYCSVLVKAIRHG